MPVLTIAKRWRDLRPIHAHHGAERRWPARAVLLGLLLALIGMLLLGVGIGAVPIAPDDVLAILLRQLGADVVVDARQASVLVAIRLPRVLLGALIGSGLAVAGVLMQGLFRNPLADPGLIGISSGAALAAVAVIVLGATTLRGLARVAGVWTLPLAAFGGGLLTTTLIYRLARQQGRTPVATLLLAGIAINALAGALTGLLTFVATDEQLRSITFWNLGSLGGATWRAVGAAAPPLLLVVLSAPRFAQALNLLLLGEQEARHLGVDVERLKRWIVAWTSLAVGASVAVAGSIGFIGLVVPHLLRLALGPDHRVLLPGAALLGATLLLGADLLARTLVTPAELPIGIVTALLGAPFFLWLLRQDATTRL
ncbi:FecCD family ABC transporter permease [Kallotenue papyrolyticum]|uniref:FecCD family ABC transporter permease n=1 Tax=Kallotenue papyrolyticum TaxID=1325125 RepID=UPI0004785996|nr:iron ABC transporter permease [Kallotenue papyrolyticum]